MARWGVVALLVLLGWPAQAGAAEVRLQDGRVLVLGSDVPELIEVVRSADAVDVLAQGTTPPAGCTAIRKGVRCPSLPVLVQAAGGNDEVGVRGDDVAVEGGADTDDLVDYGGLQRWDGGPGVDTLDLRGHAPGVEVDLAAARGADGDALAGVEGVIGTKGDDRLLGSAGRDRLDGHTGDDLVEGRGGRDELHGDADTGGDGRDRVLGGPGDDQVAGDGGRDLLDGGPGDDTLDLGDATFQGTKLQDFGPDVAAERPRCGPGRDVVEWTEVRDLVARDCEGAVAGQRAFEGLTVFRPRVVRGTLVLRTAVDLDSERRRWVVVLRRADGRGPVRSNRAQTRRSRDVLRLRPTRGGLGRRVTLRVYSVFADDHVTWELR